MTIPQKHTIKGDKAHYNYMLFDSVGSFNAFVDGEAGQLTDANQNVWKDVVSNTQHGIDSGTDWYGTPTPSGINELEQHKMFLGMHLLKELQPKIKEQLSRYMVHLDSDVMPKPKVAYNDRGLGMFSFDRASMGLFRLSKISIRTPLDKATSQLNIELGRTGMNTIVKKVYAFFQNKKTSYPSLRLYIMAGANARVQGNDMLYVGLACSELVEFLEMRGVAVEVNVLVGNSFRNTVNVGVVRVKRFQDKADKNQLLLMSSDPRYFRFRGFKALIALSNHFGLTIPSGLGSLTESMGKEFVTVLGGDGFVFEQSYSLESAAKEVSRIIETYNQKMKDAKAA